MFFLIASLLCGGLWAQTPTDSIRWAPDIASAREASARFGVPLIVHFYGDACLPCRTLEQRVFSKPEAIAAMNRYFICVAVNATKQPELASQWAVHSWPTDVFLAPDGEPLYRGVSPQDIRDFMSVLTNVAVMNRDRNVMLAAKKQAAESNVSANMPAYNGATQDTLREAHPELTSMQALGSNSQTSSSTTNYYSPNNPAPQQASMASSLPSRPGVQTGPVSPSQQPTALAAPSSKAGSMGLMHPEFQSQAASPSEDAASALVSAGAQPALPPIPVLEPSSTEDALQVPEKPSAVNSPVAGQFVAASRQTTPDRFQLPTSAGSVVQDNPYADSSPSQASQAQSGIAQTDSAMAPVLDASQSPGLDGYCPVALRQQQWTPGSASLAVKHRGKVYWLSSESAVQTFLAQADEYAPALSGYDPQVLLYEGKLMAGSTQHGLFESTTGQVLLFHSQESKENFQRDFEKNMRALNAVKQRSATNPQVPNAR